MLTSGAVFLVVGWHTRLRLGRLLLVTYGLALVIVAAYGLQFGGFPQPSDVIQACYGCPGPAPRANTFAAAMVRWDGHVTVARSATD
jgi:hypothetical protein